MMSNTVSSFVIRIALRTFSEGLRSFKSALCLRALVNDPTRQPKPALSMYSASARFKIICLYPLSNRSHITRRNLRVSSRTILPLMSTMVMFPICRVEVFMFQPTDRCRPPLATRGLDVSFEFNTVKGGCGQDLSYLLFLEDLTFMHK